MNSMKLNDFRLIAAPFTPMSADGSLNFDVVRDQAEHLVSSGVRGVFVGGTSGEGQALTIDERMALAESWSRDALRPKLEFIIHIGHNCQDEAIRLAAHAAALDADGVALHAPMWGKPPLNELVDFCVPIAAAASALPFYIYDIPKITGSSVSSAKFLAAAKPQIPNLAGVKYTNPDCITAQECIQADGGNYDILWGTDEALLAGVTLGASGAVGSTYNFAAPLYLRILDAIAADDWITARIEQARAIAMVRVFEQFSTLAALKFAMSLVGVDCGPVRSPLGNLNAADKRRLRSDLDQLGFTQFTANARPVISSCKSA